MSRIEEGESIDIKDKTRSKLRKLLGKHIHFTIH